MARSDGKVQMGNVRALLLDWDAIGVADISRDEYDCMIGPLLRRLHDGADADGLYELIAAERAGHFGLNPDPQSDRALAERLIAWWSRPDDGRPPPA